ncbi:D-arabinono-1,4-lactone oxidase [Dyadobacter sp. LHD-138]|uniref:D-arabinono-1,4-lactone oxidase n=1 Tax=Dyadobacter sp. LHD-138 TaxID=3071413 RepID=UPI0027E152FC|nr:D-arabinono-1,4-lactone oxidase [Dyadobacter sp. LHD-138]MDQ6480296.1 D-arabinono-1,4-lactone oxidase [Dyadobacter sp. LHD-138]
MKKRTFIKLSSALMTAPLFSPLTGWATGEKLKNWAGNLEYGTTKLFQAGPTAQVQDFVKKHTKFKVLGTRHCFNKIADSTDAFISVVQAEENIEIHADGKTVTVNAGLKYGQLSPYLDKKGLALHNLASLPHISVAGACATATHGSGEKNGNLATAVSGFEMVTGAGDIVKLSREKDGEKFLSAVVNLGALGVVTKITLDIQPTFQMNQFVYENLQMTQLKEHFDEIESTGYSVSLFTNWQSRDIAEVWVKRKIEKGENYKPGPTLFGAKLATKNLHPIPELSAENCTEQMGVPGPWYERMPHFKMGFTPSSGKELQSEYFVPRKNAVEAIMAISRLADQVGPHLLTSEIRTIAADGFWMSPCYGQDSVAIHFTWKQDWPAVRRLLPVIEKELAPFHARPHWGKLFTMTPEKLKSLYVKLPDFQKLAKEFDPKGKLRNGFLNTYIYQS